MDGETAKQLVSRLAESLPANPSGDGALADFRAMCIRVIREVFANNAGYLHLLRTAVQEYEAARENPRKISQRLKKRAVGRARALVKTMQDEVESSNAFGEGTPGVEDRGR